MAQEKTWRCFHCDEYFTDREEAALHFGTLLGDEPGCKLNKLEGGLLGLLRQAHLELRSYREEDTALLRQVWSLGAESNTKIREAEERGYARGMKDSAFATVYNATIEEMVTIIGRDGATQMPLAELQAHLQSFKVQNG